MSDTAERLNAALEGRYRIDREIGRGGMGTVYLAHDLRHERSVALKVLRPDLAEAIGAERFLQEIRVTANLQHPHILPLFDSGQADGHLYFVMPHVEGESLGARLAREGKLPVSDAVRILREVVDALGEAHARGVVHRDVKPANVLLAGRHALVADFGIAKAVSAASDTQQLTTIGVAIGTPRYMAPEQASADPRTDHRADLFAAGVMGYEMLTGESPFAGDTAQSTLAALLTRTPRPISELRKGVSEELAAAIERCLEKDPDDRWQTASELRIQLELVETPAGGVAATARGRLALGLVAVAAVAFAVFYFGRFGESRETWARDEAIPEIERLADAGAWEDAVRLVALAEEAIPDYPQLQELRSSVARPLTIRTEPLGATVFRHSYAASDGDWERLGPPVHTRRRRPLHAGTDLRQTGRLPEGHPGVRSAGATRRTTAVPHALRLLKAGNPERARELVRERQRAGLSELEDDLVLGDTERIVDRLRAAADRRDQSLLFLKCDEVYPELLDIPEVRAIIDDLPRN